jgi:hypothetical protein
MKRKRSNSVRTKPTTILFTVLIILGVLGAAAAVVMNTTGWVRVSDIRTDSMAPAVAKNSLTITMRVPLSEVKRGDIISVRTAVDNNQDVLGRVKSISREKGTNIYDYNIQADNNPLPDQWGYKSSGEAYKLVASIPVLGFIPFILKSIWGAALLGVIILALAGLYVWNMHGPISTTTKLARARKRAEYLKEERDSHNGVDEIYALFAEKEVAEER